MKIAHLISEYLPSIGGAEICVHNIASRHANAGHRVVVVTTTSNKGQEIECNYETRRLNSNLPKLLRRFPLLGRAYLGCLLKKLQNEYHFDIWQVTVGYPLGVYAIDFFVREHIPAVLRCSGDDIQQMEEIDYGVRLNPNVDRLVCDSYKRYDVLIANSESMKEEYERIGAEKSKIVHIPNGVDCQRFSTPVDRQQIREKLGIPQEALLIITVGRNHPKKGYSLIPQIAACLKKRDHNFLWLIVGKGTEQLQPLIRECKVEKVVRTQEEIGLENKSSPGKAHLELPNNALLGLYQAADIYAFPSLLEGMPTILPEAMAAGLCVVTTDAPGCREVIKDEYNGLQAKAGNVEEFVRQLARLLEDGNLRKELVENGLNSAKQYDWDVVSRKYLEVYENLITHT